MPDACLDSAVSPRAISTRARRARRRPAAGLASPGPRTVGCLSCDIGRDLQRPTRPGAPTDGRTEAAGNRRSDQDASDGVIDAASVIGLNDLTIGSVITLPVFVST